ncbi:MAG: flagellar motor switch protein FliG [Candidatus Latescibacterota bacterium]|nr:flagellar motor switch protein FliG [Candidatus Latescibacterota bacterium]
MNKTPDVPTEKQAYLEEEEPILSPREKVAVLMIALGQDGAADIMKFLADYEIEEITRTIAELKYLPVELQDGVLGEFEQHLLAGEYMSQGGVDFARGALESAVGPHRAQEILDRVMSTVSSGFHLLKNVPPEQIAPFISHEHPQTIALILSQLDSAQAAGILSQLPEVMQSEVSYRIATMENITPNVLRQIKESLEENLRDILGGNQDVGGPKVVADMLNLTVGSVEKNVLHRLDAQDPEVAEFVRNQMFIFEDIQRLTDREIQTVLREVEQKDIVISLKAASQEVKDKFLANMSDRIRRFVEEELDFLSPMRLSEVVEVQLKIVQKIRQLEDQGQIQIVRGPADDTIV